MTNDRFTRRPVVDLTALAEHTVIVKGLSELLSQDPIDPDSIRFDAGAYPATHDSIGLLNSRVIANFRSWGFTDQEWIDDAASAVVEQATYIVAAAMQSEKSGVMLQFLFQFLEGERYRYFMAVIDDDGVVIDTSRLEAEPPLDPHDRPAIGAYIIRHMSEVFLAFTNATGTLILKKELR